MFPLPRRMGLDLIGFAGLGNPTDPGRTRVLAAIDKIAANTPSSSGVPSSCRNPSPFGGWFTPGEETS